MMRCAASAMDCSPELQNRLMLKARGARGEAGAQGDRARDVAAGGAFAEGRTHDHVLDFGGIDAGAFHRVPHRMRAERGAIGHVEGALPALAQTGARRGYDNRFCHLGCPLNPLKVWPCSARRVSSGAGVQNAASLLGLRRDSLERAHDVVQSDLVGIEHGSAAEGRKSISIEVHDVDVGGSLRDAVLDDAGAFIDQRIDAALDDLLRAHGARRDAFLPCGIAR